jgi:hypothetical protein
MALNEIATSKMIGAAGAAARPVNVFLDHEAFNDANIIL